MAQEQVKPSSAENKDLVPPISTAVASDEIRDPHYAPILLSLGVACECVRACMR